MSLACVGSTCSVPATLGLPLIMEYYFPHLHCSGFRLLYRDLALNCVHFSGHFSGPGHSGSGFWVLHKVTDSIGPEFFALPRSKQLR